MLILTRIIGAGVLVYAIYSIYRGRISGTDDSDNSYTHSRAEKPVQFWLEVLFMLVAAGFALFYNFDF
jgi:hypothetical protein